MCIRDRDEEAGVIDNEMESLSSLFLIPSDPVVAQRRLPGGRSPDQIGELPSVRCHNPVAQIGPHGDPIAEIMIALDKGIAAP